MGRGKGGEPKGTPEQGGRLKALKQRYLLTPKTFPLQNLILTVLGSPWLLLIWFLTDLIRLGVEGGYVQAYLASLYCSHALFSYSH